jgi:hypothetical protein
MQFKPFEPGIEILGHGVSFIVAGFKMSPSIGLRFLVKHGVIPPGRDGKPVLELNVWYSQAKWLKAFEDIASTVGKNVLFEIGRRLGLEAWAPDQMKDVPSALQFLDIGYHSYHRRFGEVMFDAKTGRMLEGIGHIGCRPVPGERRIISVCENPYPCRFDLGLLTGLAARFQAGARVDHDDKAPCRDNGADSCTYIISW